VAASSYEVTPRSRAAAARYRGSADRSHRRHLWPAPRRVRPVRGTVRNHCPGYSQIGRIWHGWTKPDNANRYERLLKEEIFTGIADKKVPGYRGIQLFRRPIDDEEVEFVTIMWFDSWEAVKRFAGEDYERAYVPSKAREVLARFDERSQHYEIRERLDY
jgi:heme-degrading monooxygenase HmoA